MCYTCKGSDVEWTGVVSNALLFLLVCGLSASVDVGAFREKLKKKYGAPFPKPTDRTLLRAFVFLKCPTRSWPRGRGERGFFGRALQPHPLTGSVGFHRVISTVPCSLLLFAALPLAAVVCGCHLATMLHRQFAQELLCCYQHQ